MATQQRSSPKGLLSTQARAELELALLALIWGVNFSVIKVALQWVPPTGFNALRFPLAAAILFLALGKSRLRTPRREDIPRLLMVGVIGNVAYQLCFIVGIEVTLAGNGSILLATSPLWTACFAVLAGQERVSREFWLGALGALAGICLVVLGGGADAALLERSTVFGDSLILIAAVVWALYTVAGRPLVERYGALSATAWTLWVGTLPLVIIGLPTLNPAVLSGMSAKAWAGVLYAGVLGIGVAYLIWYRAVEVLGSSRTAMISNTIPIVAMAVAWVWLGERPAPLQYLGAALVLFGVAWTRRARVTPRTTAGVGV